MYLIKEKVLCSFLLLSLFLELISNSLSNTLKEVSQKSNIDWYGLFVDRLIFTITLQKVTIALKF